MGKSLLRRIDQGMATEAQLQTISLTLMQSDVSSKSDKASLAKQWVETLGSNVTDYGLGRPLFELALQGQHTSKIATVAEAGDSQVDFGRLALARRHGNTALVSQWLLKD